MDVRRLLRMWALAILPLSATCTTATPPPSLPPGHAARGEAATVLRQGVPVTIIGGLEVGTIDLETVFAEGKSWLLIRVTRAGGHSRRYLVDAVVRGVTGGHQVTFTAADGATLRAVVPDAADPRTGVSASRGMDGVEITLDHGDGRREILTLQVDEGGVTPVARLAHQLQGPFTWQSLGRPVLARSGPISVRLRSADRAGS